MKHVRDGTETYINGVNISTSRERIKKALELNAHSTGNSSRRCSAGLSAEEAASTASSAISEGGVKGGWGGGKAKRAGEDERGGQGLGHEAMVGARERRVAKLSRAYWKMGHPEEAAAIFAAAGEGWSPPIPPRAG